MGRVERMVQNIPAAVCVMPAGRRKTPSTYSGRYLEWAGGQENKLAIALAMNHLEDDEEPMQCQSTLYILFFFSVAGSPSPTRLSSPLLLS